MFDLQVPVWELVLRAALVYVGMLVLLRLSGKRTIGQFSPFDVLVMLLLAEAAQGALTAGEESVTGGLIAVVTLISLNYLVAFISARSKRAETFIEGEPVVVVRDGKVLDRALKQNNLPECDLDEAMRSAQIRDRRDVQLAILEPGGSISFFKREE